MAVRHVQTPDGAFAQGFVVERARLDGWLAARTGDMLGELQPSEAQGVPVAPGWTLSVAPPAQALARAAADADAVRSGFILRFIGIGSLAVAACACVLFFLMRAETLARERSQFAAAAAHELRTPLAGLQLYGEMLADGLGNPERTREYARRISEDAARLGRVVSNMLGFSQLERGQITLDVKEGSISDVLRELVERAKPSLERAGAAIDADLTAELQARFDRDAVARIIGNLLDNAEKYGRGGSRSAIQLSALERGDTVEIKVEDRGRGVTDSTRLFRAFSRGSNASGGPPGLGLGLALSKSLARAMGGDLFYQARDGGGSTFVLRLPRA